jgi:endo-1,4-beta-xylanase
MPLVAKVSLGNALVLEAPLPSAYMRCCFAALAYVFCTAALAADVVPLPVLHEVFQDDFLVGVSLDGNELPDKPASTPQQQLLTHFNAITPENDMKWERLQPTEGQFNFEAADALVDYAEKHQKSFTMHTLVWHRQTPDWVFKDTDGNPAPRELVIARLRNHINVVMQRYRGRVAGWDVVNEALSDAPNEYLRDSPWLRTIGEDYVALAFKFAREADPDAKLYYNDYAIEYPHKREKMIRLVKELKAAGAAPDAVNLQGHFSLGTPSIAEIEHTLEAIAALGLRANISELDVSLFNFLQTDNPYPESAPADILEKQAQRYRELFTLFLHHKAKLDRVTFWNLHDGVSWLNNHPVPGRKDYPLLFDQAGKPKPAFFHVIKAASK